MAIIHKKSIFLPLLLIALSACTATRQSHVAKSEAKNYSRKAIELVIDASTQELLGNNEQALLLYQEAQLYDSSSAGLDLAIAKIYQNLGRYQSAMKVLEQGLRKDSSNYEILNNLVVLLEIKQDFPNVLKLYRKMLSLKPEDYTLKNRLARVYSITGNRDAAIALYEEIVKLDNIKPEIQQTLGNLYLQKGDKANALRCYKTLISAYPVDEPTYLRLGQLFQEIGDTTSAIALFKDAIKVNPRHNRVVNELADIYLSQRKPQNALALLETYYKQDTTSFFKISALAEAHENYGDKRRATYLFHQLSDIYPQEWRAWCLVGRNEYRRQNGQESLSYVKRACKLTDDGLPEILLAQNYYQLDSLKAAENILRELYPGRIGNPEINYLLGLVIKKQKRNNEAVPFFQRVLKSKPDDGDAINMLAETYADSRLYAQSDSLYEKALQHAKNKPFLQNNYSYNLAERGENLEYANSLIDRALQDDPDNGAFLDTKGWILFKMGRYEKAIDYLLKSLQVKDKDADVYEHLGDVYIKSGERQNALAAWKQALSIDGQRERLILKIKRYEK